MTGLKSNMSYNSFAAPARPASLHAQWFEELDRFAAFGQMAVEAIDITTARDDEELANERADALWEWEWENTRDELGEERCDLLCEWLEAQRAARRVASRKVEDETDAKVEVAPELAPSPHADNLAQPITTRDPNPPAGEPVSAIVQLLPNEQDLARFMAAVFKRADPKGIVSLRAFPDAVKNASPVFIEPISLGDPQFLPVVAERARQAANWRKPAVFCPPVVTLKDGRNAKADNVREGVTLPVECDAQPNAALSFLREILGDPTVVVASGGEWTNPETGEVEQKVHAHWRLKVPTRTPQEHVRRREARDLAAKLVGADATAIPLVHPLRWPGSWHRKATPRLAKIIFESENEIDLVEALRVLRAAAGAAAARAEELDPFAECDPFTEYGQRVAKQGKSNEELIALLKQSRATPGKGWREPMLRFIGSAVGKGWSDLAIKLACAPYSDGGVDDDDIQKIINDTRKNFDVPEPGDVAIGPPSNDSLPQAKASTALALTYFGEFGDKAKKRPILKGFLNKGETSGLIGPPKTLKSALETEIAVHCAAGMHWRGHSADGPCGVVIFALERADLYRRRLDAYRLRGGFKEKLPIAVAGEVIDLLNTKCVTTIVATVREAEKKFGCAVGLIVIDTFSKGIAAGGGDEDKAKDQNRVAANLRRVHSLIDVHIACVGHTGKDETRGARGSNAHLGDIDLMIQITGGENKVKTAKVTAANDQPERVLAQFQAELVEIGVDDDGEIETVSIIQR